MPKKRAYPQGIEGKWFYPTMPVHHEQHRLERHTRTGEFRLYRRVRVHAARTEQRRAQKKHACVPR